MNSTHPNAQILTALYINFQTGKIAEAMAACAENCTFQLAGKSKLAGKYDKARFASVLMPTLMELSAGTYQLETHDVMASDRHGVVLGTQKVTRAGKTSEMRVVHVWRFEKGKPVAWYEYQRDLYAFDAFWT